MNLGILKKNTTFTRTFSRREVSIAQGVVTQSMTLHLMTGAKATPVVLPELTTVSTVSTAIETLRHSQGTVTHLYCALVIHLFLKDAAEFSEKRHMTLTLLLYEDPLLQKTIIHEEEGRDYYPMSLRSGNGIQVLVLHSPGVE